MNKTDFFAEKLPHPPLGNYLPDYQGGTRALNLYVDLVN
jgi:hypothetical protein